jgi:hypothetical protein
MIGPCACRASRLPLVAQAIKQAASPFAGVFRQRDRKWKFVLYTDAHMGRLLSMLPGHVHSRFRRIGWLGMVCVLFIGTMAGQGWTDWQGGAEGPQLRARLIDSAANAEKHVASVEVEVKHVWLHSPVAPVSQYGARSALLEYKLDNDPSVVTSDTRLKFEQLAPGNHVIAIMLIGIDDRQIGSVAKLSVAVP